MYLVFRDSYQILIKYDMVVCVFFFIRCKIGLLYDDIKDQCYIGSLEILRLDFEWIGN